MLRQFKPSQAIVGLRAQGREGFPPIRSEEQSAEGIVGGLPDERGGALLTTLGS